MKLKDEKKVNDKKLSTENLLNALSRTEYDKYCNKNCEQVWRHFCLSGNRKIANSILTK